MKRTMTFLFCALACVCLHAQTYSLTVETQVGTRNEDKFSFSLSPKVAQTKGFESKLLAKRYRAQGFLSKELERQKMLEEEEKKDSDLLKMKPIDVVRDMLEKTRKESDFADHRLETAQSKKEALAEKVKELEDLLEKAARNQATFERAFAEFQKKYGINAEEMKYKQMMRKRPRDTGDVDEVEIGSFCTAAITKVSEKVAHLDVDYAYNRIASGFYADGNNNDNTVTKITVIERFSKLGVKDLKLPLGKTYCFQFARKTGEKGGSLSEAASQAGIFGGGDGSGGAAASVEEPKSELDAEGFLPEIKRKFPDDAGKVVRVLITVKEEK